MNYIGKPVPREEDLRLLQGKGRYLDDVRALDLVHAAVFRSPVAHGDIVSLNVEASRAASSALLEQVARGQEQLVAEVGEEEKMVEASTAELAEAVQSRQELAAELGSTMARQLALAEELDKTVHERYSGQNIILAY